MPRCAGNGSSIVLAVGAREHQPTDAWGGYTRDEVALRHGAGPDEDTSDPEAAYARFVASVPSRYRDGLLPSD
jgi:hypothetical protein